MSPARQLSVLCLLAAACGRSPTAQVAPAAPAAPTAGQELAIAPGRVLPPNSTFADLVRAASLLDATDSPAESCLLGKDAAGAIRLAGEVRAGLRPLPQPALELDEPLRAADDVQVLTPWGPYGSRPGTLAFASFTDFPPLRDAIVLVITDRGVSLRSTAGSGTLGAALAPQAKSLSALGSLDGVVAFVAAEAAVPTTQVYALLEELGRLGAPRRARGQPRPRHGHACRAGGERATLP